MRLFVFLIGSLAWAQTFEVASIRPAEPLGPGVQTGTKISAGQASYRSRSLRELIALAYRTQDVYFLEQTTGGHKMKDALSPPAEDSDPAQGFEMPKSIRIPGMKGTRLGATPSDGMRQEWQRMTMAELTQHISPLLDRRVVDRTGLTGAYQVTIEVSMEEITHGMLSYGNFLPSASQPPPGVASDPSGASIPASLKKLGLTLEKDKGELEMIVIDSVEIKPTEN